MLENMMMLSQSQNQITNITLIMPDFHLIGKKHNGNHGDYQLKENTTNTVKNGISLDVIISIIIHKKNTIVNTNYSNANVPNVQSV